MALDGIRNSMEAGLKVGLRFTIFKHNAAEAPQIFDLLEREGVPRVCFYHLVYAGRGSSLMEEDLSHADTRKLLDLIMDRTKALFDKGQAPEVLTVDNHADGPYVYLRMLREDPERAEEVLKLLQWNEGNSSGRGHRLRELGRQRTPGPVLAAFDHRQRAQPALQRDLVRHQPPHPGQAQGQTAPPHRALRPVPLAGHLRRQFPGCAPRRPRAISGPRTRPVTSPTRR